MAISSTVEERPPQHQVFINFRGAELRNGFVSHLVTALQSKDINVFIDKLEDRGKPIEILLDRIQKSRIALVIFSGKYTESVWCMREVAKIKDCMDEGTLEVIPIFYKVEPSTVKYLMGDFGDTFRSLAMNEYDEGKEKWEDALKAVSGIMGTVVDEKSEESEIVKKTVDDIRKALIRIPSEGSQTTSVNPSPNRDTRTSSGEEKHETFGNELRLKELEEKLDRTIKKTCIIGVVGMPGIGKTTLLKELFNKWQNKFNRCALIDEIRGKSNPSEDFDILPKLLVRELLAFNVSTLENVEDPYEVFKGLLLNEKVLVILDDVSKSEQIDALLGKRDWITEGSRIVIATNDMSLLKDWVTDTYVVPLLNHQDGLKLFHYHAFDEANPPEDFMQLSKEFVHFARGLPLALKILGKELYGKGRLQWEEKRKLLAESPSPFIESVFRVSYDELSSDQKKAFLDIACFRSQDVAYVESLLASSEAMSAVKALTDKFLINTCDGRVEMHDLLYTFSRELDPKTSTEDDRTGRRLWRHQDIIKEGKINVVQKEMRAAHVRGIFLDLSQVKGETSLAKDHFNRMTNLRYLKVYNSHCPQECKTENRINIPDGLKLPLKEVRCLHWLKFPLDELPEAFNPINLVDLKLPYSEIERLWEGDKDTPVLKWVDLNHSSMLSSLSGLSKAPNLQGLNLEGCTRLESLADVDSKSLKSLTLSGCTSFKKFPLIPENLEALHLDRTAISQLPDNVVNLKKLVLLNMKDCELLENIPTCVDKLKALQKLVLSGCKKLQNFPEVNKSSLKILLLDRTAIKTMPQLPSVQYLCLSFNDHLSCIPADINQLSQLTRLDLKYCKSLTSVPELPPNLQYFDADGCSALKTVAKPLARIMPTVQNHCTFNFTNCGNLEQAAKEEIASYAQRKCQLLSDARKHYDEGLSSEALFTTCFPGCEVPSWFCHDGVGSRLELKLLPHWHDKSLSGIALCAVISFPGVEDQTSGLSVACTFTIKAGRTSWIPFTCPVGSWTREGETIQSNHVFIAYISCPHTIRCLKDENSDKCNFTEASLEFTVTGGTSEIGKVLRCGLSLVYEKNKNKNSSHEATYDMPVEVSYKEPQRKIKKEVLIDDQRINEKSDELIPSSITRTCGASVTPIMGDLQASS
ncbi:unnamed protein product [Arabidopsis lyrata]|nr:unnamed protein product [Arabidopsis lyrata]